MTTDMGTEGGGVPDSGTGPVFVDTTIRDGGQSPGVFFDRPTKMAIVTTLSRIGVREIEVGSPCLGEHELEDLRVLCSLPVPAEMFPWLRPLDEDFESALRLGFKRVHVSFPTSDVHRESVRGMGRTDAVERVRKAILHLSSEGCRVSIGLDRRCAQRPIRGMHSRPSLSPGCSRHRARCHSRSDGGRCAQAPHCRRSA